MRDIVTLIALIEMIAMLMICIMYAAGFKITKTIQIIILICILPQFLGVMGLALLSGRVDQYEKNEKESKYVPVTYTVYKKIP